LVDWARSPEGMAPFVERVSSLAAAALVGDGRMLTCGNGGSMCDAMHCAEELSGRYRKDRIALAAQAIGDAAHFTCVANDFGFDQVFRRGVEAWGRAGDVLMIFSTSGNSPNILEAAKAARERKLIVVGLLGRDGGAALPLCHEALVVPAKDSGRIQEIHI